MTVARDFLETQLTYLKARYKWLHEMANNQAEKINESLAWEIAGGYYTEKDNFRRIVFYIKIYNNSVFDIAIEDVMKGYIEVKGHRLLGTKQLTYNPSRIFRSGKDTLSIEQRLDQPDVDIVNGCLNELMLVVKGAAEFPQVKSADLRLGEIYIKRGI